MILNTLFLHNILLQTVQKSRQIFIIKEFGILCYIRRPIGTRYNSRYQISTLKRGSNVIVWRSFSYDGVGSLVEIKGIMDTIILHYL